MIRVLAIFVFNLEDEDFQKTVDSQVFSVRFSASMVKGNQIYLAESLKDEYCCLMESL